MSGHWYIHKIYWWEDRRRQFDIIRVIGGKAGGHRLKTPKGNNTRPTTDRIKESVFNIVSPYLFDARILDLFSGTGSLGVEAISRGAVSGVFVERDSGCCRIIEDNLTSTHLMPQAEVLCMDVSKAVCSLGKRNDKFDIIFLDPPYLKNFILGTLQNIIRHDIINPKGILCVERHRDEKITDAPDGLDLRREKSYGETVFSFYVFDRIFEQAD